MPVQDHLPSSHRNQYSADSACGHCDGVIRHELWCITQNTSVQYAYQAISDPDHLGTGDELILHALGAASDREKSFGRATNQMVVGTIPRDSHL